MSWLLPNWITGYDEENYAAGKEAGKKNAQITRDLQARDLITEDNARIAALHYADSDAYDPEADIEGEFGKGIDEGAANIRNGVGATINAVAITPLKLIPWQLWLIGLVLAAWKLGLLDGVFKGFVKRAR